MSFTLRVLGNLATPSVCNDQEYQAELASVINGYISEQSFSVLAARYAENLANGRFLWRNRVGAEDIKVCITSQTKSYQFDSNEFSLRQFSQPSKELTALAQEIEQGLAGNGFAFFTVDAFVRLGNGQEVFPSQELVLDSNSKKAKCYIRLMVLRPCIHRKWVMRYVPLMIGIQMPLSWLWGRLPLNPMAR